MTTPKRIFVGLYGALGDVLLSTPLLESLRSAYPDSHITFALGRDAAPLLQHLPLVDRLIVISRRTTRNVREDITFMKQLFMARFDVAVCLSRSVKMVLPLALGRVPVRVGFLPANFARLYTHGVDSRQLPVLHRSQYFLQAASVLGIPSPATIRLHYQMTAEERSWAERRLASLGVDLERDQLIAVHPGTSVVLQEKRRWPPERFADLAQALSGSSRWRIVLLDDGRDTVNAQLAERAQESGWINLANQLNLRQLAAVVSRCRLLVHNDSAPLHLAVALGVPVVSIFGYQDVRLWGPLGKLDRVVRRDLECSPCAPDFPCPHEFKCIRGLPVSEVMQATLSVLSSLEQQQS